MINDWEKVLEAEGLGVINDVESLKMKRWAKGGTLASREATALAEAQERAEQANLFASLARDNRLTPRGRSIAAKAASGKPIGKDWKFRKTLLDWYRGKSLHPRTASVLLAKESVKRDKSMRNEAIRRTLSSGMSVKDTAIIHGVSRWTVQAIKKQTKENDDE